MDANPTVATSTDALGPGTSDSPTGLPPTKWQAPSHLEPACVLPTSRITFQLLNCGYIPQPSDAKSPIANSCTGLGTNHSCFPTTEIPCVSHLRRNRTASHRLYNKTCTQCVGEYRGIRNSTRANCFLVDAGRLDKWCLRI